MTHTLLVAAVALFVLWVVGLAGGWAAHTAWTLFVIACVLFAAWIVVGLVSGGGIGRKRAV